MSPSRSTILVAGSANVDFVVRAAHVPAPGETILGRDFATFTGGKGANQAVACARAGSARTAMLVALGQDAFAPLIEASLRDAGIELHIVRSDQRTGVALICLADSAENAITVAPGANSYLRPDHLPELHDVRYLLLQLETPLETVSAFARRARQSGVQVMLNAAPARELSSDLLASLDVLVVNEDELTKLAGGQASIKQMLANVPVPCVVVTLGARGCCARHENSFLVQPAFEVEAIDTTGAGDTFCGALAAALCADFPLREAMRRASAAAALATTRVGAQSSIPTYDEVESLLRSKRDERNGLNDLLAYCGLTPPAVGLPPTTPSNIPS